MPLLDALFSVSDDDRVLYQTDEWQIRFHCWRGYEPWYTLHRRRKFLGFSWWSSAQKFGMGTQSLIDFIKRWEDWPIKNCDVFEVE